MKVTNTYIFSYSSAHGIEFHFISLLNYLKVLIVLAGSPVAAPLEAGLGEELEAEVVVGDLVGEVPRTCRPCRTWQVAGGNHGRLSADCSLRNLHDKYGLVYGY